MEGHVERMWTMDERNAYRNGVRKSEGKTLLENKVKCQLDTTR